MEENKNELKIGDNITGINCCGDEVSGKILGFEDSPARLPFIKTDLYPDTLVWKARLSPTEVQMTATLWSMLEAVNHEATRAREYLRLTGATCTPDRVHEILHLRTSRATLGRKMREAAQRGELVRSYYVNDRGTKICQYSFNQEAK